MVQRKWGEAGRRSWRGGTGVRGACSIEWEGGGAVRGEGIMVVKDGGVRVE